MFGRKCRKCNERINKKFDYCPYCGTDMNKSFSNEREDYGFLGKNDEINEFDKLFMGIKSPVINKMLGSAIKMLEKEMRGIHEINKKPLSMPRTNFQLFVNGRKINIPNNAQRIEREGISREAKKHREAMPKISEDLLQKSIKLPRKEAKTSLSRIANKVIYEIDTPGLNRIENVLINTLENSLEVKVYTDKAVYFKTLPVKLPLMQYSIKDEKLFLEFKA